MTKHRTAPTDYFDEYGNQHTGATMRRYHDGLYITEPNGNEFFRSGYSLRLMVAHSPKGSTQREVNEQRLAFFNEQSEFWGDYD